MARPLRRARLRAAALTLPLVAFVGVTFIAPLGLMLVRSVHEPVVADALPRTLALLKSWDGIAAPGEDAFRVLGGELRALHERRRLGTVATRVNRLESGMRSKIVATARALENGEPASWRDAMIAADPVWGEAKAWVAVRRAGERFTLRHYLNALDLDRDLSGAIVARPPDQRIYLTLLRRTLAVGLVITAICLLLGYPVAYLIANAPPSRSNLLLVLVLVPFWTSLLVRTTSWIVLLQSQGVVNDLLVAIGAVDEDGRLALVYNMFGTIVAMTQILLPFMILPLYAVMRSISPTHLRAGVEPRGDVPPRLRAGLLAPDAARRCRRIAPRVHSLDRLLHHAGTVGGQTGQLISNMIAYHMQQSLNWGLAAALGAILLGCVAMLYAVYDRLVGIERMRLA